MAHLIQHSDSASVSVSASVSDPHSIGNDDILDQASTISQLDTHSIHSSSFSDQNFHLDHSSSPTLSSSSFSTPSSPPTSPDISLSLSKPLIPLARPAHQLPRSPGWATAQIQANPNVHAHKPLFANPPHSLVLARLPPTRSFDHNPPSVHLLHHAGLRHSEFGFDLDEADHMWTSKFTPNDRGGHVFEDAGYLTYMTTYWSYLLVFVIGHIRDAFRKRISGASHLKPHDGYAALNSDFGSFFTRRVKSRLDDCFGRPVTGAAARTITLLDRTSADNCVTFQYTHTTTQALNISSYNYLGFAQSQGSCADAVERTIANVGVSTGGARDDVGTTAQLVEAERLLARFVGAEAALLVSQGFATNSTTLPALVSKGALVVSDELNHASIRFGTRLSRAMVRTYKHNDMADLERVLREAISQGQPRKLRAWTKIVVVVEGIYSMEGSIVNLPDLLKLKERYKFYLYLDEAHSIGALGPNGRGVCDYYNLSPSRVDVLMGTLTKSFGASGGYVAGSKAMVAHMRKACHSAIYAEPVSPAVLTQITSAIKAIMGKEAPGRALGDGQLMDPMAPDEGQRRLRRLAYNARYLHAGLRKLGFIVVGDRDSPIVPLLVFQPGKMLLFSRLMLQRYGIVVVIVGYPATPLVLGRVRFCVSAAHTKDDLDRVLVATDDIGGALGLRLGKRVGRWSVEEVISRAGELVSGGL